MGLGPSDGYLSVLVGSDEQANEGDEILVVPIEDSIDLHFFAPRDIPSVVEEYLLEAQAKGFREVTIIHGRGKGVQRQIVQKLLTRHPAVSAFRSDRLAATVVELRAPGPPAEGSGEP